METIIVYKRDKMDDKEKNLSLLLNFVEGKKSYVERLKGVYIDKEGLAVATNSSSLIAINLQELPKWMQTLEVGKIHRITATKSSVQYEGIIDFDFPDWRKVVPSETATDFTFRKLDRQTYQTSEFLAGLYRAMAKKGEDHIFVINVNHIDQIFSSEIFHEIKVTVGKPSPNQASSSSNVLRLSGQGWMAFIKPRADSENETIP